MPTRGAACTFTLAYPALASRPAPAGATTSPACITASPAWASSAAERTFSPTLAGAEKRTCEPSLPSPSSTSTISYFTTASAPSGTGAPVMMRTVSPVPTTPSKTWPAASCPITSSVTGVSPDACAKSAERTAYPSIALLANGEMSISATASSAKGRPAACHTGISTRSVGAACDRTIDCASFSGMSFSAICTSLMPRRTTGTPILYVCLSIIPRRATAIWPVPANTPVGRKPRNRMETNPPARRACRVL